MITRALQHFLVIDVECVNMFKVMLRRAITSVAELLQKQRYQVGYARNVNTNISVIHNASANDCSASSQIIEIVDLYVGITSRQHFDSGSAI